MKWPETSGAYGVRWYKHGPVYAGAVFAAVRSEQWCRELDRNLHMGTNALRGCTISNTQYLQQAPASQVGVAAQHCTHSSRHLGAARQETHRFASVLQPTTPKVGLALTNTAWTTGSRPTYAPNTNLHIIVALQAAHSTEKQAPPPGGKSKNHHQALTFKHNKDTADPF